MDVLAEQSPKKWVLGDHAVGYEWFALANGGVVRFSERWRWFKRGFILWIVKQTKVLLLLQKKAACNAGTIS